MDQHSLAQLVASPTETEVLEFKEAKNTFDPNDVLRYCAAIANEGGGHLILGVTDDLPRKAVGTRSFRGSALQHLRNSLRDQLPIHVDVIEMTLDDERVLVFEIPARPAGTAIALSGAYLMRDGESLVPMTPERLRAVFAETPEEWLSRPATPIISAADVISLLDVQKYFELVKQPFPTTQDGVLDRFLKVGLLVKLPTGWQITNLGALALAKNLEEISSTLGRRAPRVVIYEGRSKATTRSERVFKGGVASEFLNVVEFVIAAAPQNHLVEEAIRQEVKMFPIQAVRELVANALIHQDFSLTGTSVMIELYDNRVEISNPGVPPISIDRFIDEYRSRNEPLASLMRQFGICEEKGSGIDKVVSYAEAYQLPAPEFRAGEVHTTAILHSHRSFDEMSKTDRTRACYQHCVLSYVTREPMSNATLRKRFGLGGNKTAIASQIIAATKDANLIKPEESDSASTRYARYIPYWA